MNKVYAKSIALDSSQKYARLFSSKDGSALSLRSGCVVLKEGENIGEHNTEDCEEILIILEGTGELVINKSEILCIKKDTVNYVPPNTVHDVVNKGKGNLKYVYITCLVCNIDIR